MKTPEQVRQRIKDLQGSPDGDERIIGDGLHFYARGVGDEEVVKVVRGTLNGFLGICQFLLDEMEE